MKIIKHYYGISYPLILGIKPIRYLWKRFFCKRNWHQFDEVMSVHHYLSCDACDLVVKLNKSRFMNDISE